MVVAWALLAASARAEDHGAAAPAPAPPTDTIETRVVRGAHVRILAHVSVDGLAEQASEVAEAAWTLTCEEMGAEAGRRTGDPDLHLCRDPRHTGAATPGAIAMLEDRSHSGVATSRPRVAHVLLFEEHDDGILRRIGLPPETLTVVAHEAVHLAVFAHTPEGLDLPFWIQEGTADHVARRVMESRGLALDRDLEPWNVLDRERCRQLLETRRLPSIRSVFRDEWGDLDKFERYVVSRVLADFLSAPESGGRFRDILRESLRAHGVTRSFEELSDDLEDRFGAEWLPRTEFRFRRYVKSYEPAWHGYHGVFAFRDGWLQSTGPERSGFLRRVDPRPATPCSVRGALEILSQGPDDAADLTFSSAANDHVTVRFVGSRRIELLHTQGEAPPRTVAASDAPSAEGRRHEFDIRLEDGRVCVRVAGHPELRVECGPGERTWALAVPTASTVVHWSAIDLR